MKSVFVSYKYEDRYWVDKIKKWGDDGRLGTNVKIVTETADKRREGLGAVRKHLSPKLTGAGAIIVLVGEDTHTSEMVGYEIQHAKSNHKYILPVRIPNTSGGVPAMIRNLTLIAFEPNAIAYKL